MGTDDRGVGSIRNKKLYIAMLSVTALYVVSIICLNFNSGQWYDFDMYSDAYVAKLMWEEKSLFPQGWVFGNQLYVVATPALAAVLYPIFKSGYLALAAASSVMTLLTLYLFYWCCKPFCRKESIVTGLMCIAGAVVLGDTAIYGYRGLSLLYTMASYYACYMVGILFTLGVYARLSAGAPVSRMQLTAVLAINTALGIQSPRAMLVLNIPLVLTALLRLRTTRRPDKSLGFSAGVLLANLLGLGMVKLFSFNMTKLIPSPSLHFSLCQIWENVKASLSDLASLSGLGYFRSTWKWWPLFLIAVFIWCTVLLVLVLAVRRKDSSPLAQMLVYCVFSILSLLGVGVLLFFTTPRYFFV